jgi:hypothetical protein
LRSYERHNDGLYVVSSNASVSVICKAYLWGPQQLPGVGCAGGLLGWPEARLVMTILELPRCAFSCTGCNSNQLEASWRRNLFLLLHLCGRFPTRHNWRIVVAHRTHGPHDFPKPIGATDDLIPRFRGRSRHYPAFASSEPKVGQLRACWSLLNKKPEFLGLFLIYLLPRPAAPGWGAWPAGCARPAPCRRPPPLAPRQRARPWQEPN